MNAPCVRSSMEPPQVENDFPPLVVDTREQRPLAFAHLATVQAGLKTGDYSLKGFEYRFTVERKSVPDLIGSLTQGRERFEYELTRARGFDFARLLIVGRKIELMQELSRRKASVQSIAGSLAAIDSRLVPVVWADTPEKAALMVERWAVYYYAGAAKQFKRVIVPEWARDRYLA